jgi:hypothetical protein
VLFSESALAVENTLKGVAATPRRPGTMVLLKFCAGTVGVLGYPLQQRGNENHSGA